MPSVMSILVAVHRGQMLIDDNWMLLLHTRHLGKFVSYIICFCLVIHRGAAFKGGMRVFVYAGLEIVEKIYKE